MTSTRRISEDVNKHENNKQATIKGHKYSSLSKKIREIFTPVLYTVNRKTGCRAHVWSIKAGKLAKIETNKHPTKSTKKNAQFPKEKK